MNRILLTTLVCFACSAAWANPHEQYQEALVHWAQVLQAHVDDQGRVDFAALAAQPQDLKRYIDAVADYGPQTHPEHFEAPAQVLSYHINTYNAQAMYGVIERGIPEDFGSFFKRASFFRLRSVQIDGDEISLHAYENQVIRPLDEPRTHFALNCMVRDCPRLPRTPFTAQNLEAELEAVTREFFRDPNKLLVDREHGEVRLSAILDFYTVDFVPSGKAADLPAYVNRYIDETLPADYAVKFFDYDWTINRQP